MPVRKTIVIFLSALLIITASIAIYLKLESKNKISVENPVKSKEVAVKQNPTETTQTEDTPDKDLPTISELEPLSSNKWGNTPGNIANGGLFASQDGYLYFDMSYLTTGNTAQLQPRLCRTRDDGATGLVVLNTIGNASSINVVGKWLYYVDNNNICRIKTNGEDYERIYTSNIISRLYVYDGNMYFLDGFDLIKSSINSPFNFSKVASNVTSFALTEDGKSIIFMENTTFSEPSALNQASPAAIYKTDTDGGNKAKIVTLPSAEYGFTLNFAVYKNHLYFLNYSNPNFPPSVSRINLDNAKAGIERYTRDDIYVITMNIYHNFLYYATYSSNYNTLTFYRHDLDTGSITTVEGTKVINLYSPLTAFEDRLYFLGSSYLQERNNGNSMFCVDFDTAIIKENTSFVQIN